MKQALILHGTDGKPDSNWFPWLKVKLEKQGYEVWVPLLPGNHVPNRQIYNDFLLGSDFDFTDSIVVGHSSGAVEILNLLMDERCPQIKLGVLVSAWAGGVPNNWDDASQFDQLFPPKGFDFKLIETKADRLAFIHSADDTYCPLKQAQYLADNLGASLTVRQTGGHLGIPELPELLEIVKPYL